MRTRTVTLFYADGRQERFSRVVGEIHGHTILTGFHQRNLHDTQLILRLGVVRMEIA